MAAPARLEKFAAAGLAIVQLALVNGDGVPIGDGLPAAGQGKGLIRALGAQASTIDVPDPVRHNVVADSGFSKWAFQFGAEGLPTLNLTQKMMDLLLRGVVTGTKVTDVTEGIKMGGMATDQDGNEPQVVVLISEQAASGDDDAWGTAMWAHQCLPLVKLNNKPFSMTSGATESDMVYAGQANQAAKTPWGQPFTVAAHGFTKAAVLPLVSEYPITFDTYRGNGQAAQTYTLQYKPAGDETSGRVKAFNASTGLEITLTDVDVDTGVITFSDSNPANDVLAVIVYEVATGELP